MRLSIWRSWVRIPAPYTGWTFFTLICCKNCIDVCLKKTEKEAGNGPFLKSISFLLKKLIADHSILVIASIQGLWLKQHVFRQHRVGPLYNPTLRRLHLLPLHRLPLRHGRHTMPHRRHKILGGQVEASLHSSLQSGLQPDRMRHRYKPDLRHEVHVQGKRVTWFQLFKGYLFPWRFFVLNYTENKQLLVWVVV